MVVEIHLDPKQFSGAVHLLHRFVVAIASIALLLWQVLLCSASPHWQFLLLTSTSAF
jgi:hypothetical protein